MLMYRDYLKTSLWERNKNSALIRDDFKCVRCKSAKNLEFHHVRYPADFTLDTEANIITLCVNCHRKIHENDFHTMAMSKAGISEEEYNNMTVYDYARVLALSVNVNSMTERELGSYARIVTKEITSKFNIEMDKLSVINGGSHIVSLERYAGNLLYDVFHVDDLHTMYWLSEWDTFGYCPQFRLNTDYVDNELKRQEQEYIKNMGISRKEAEERFVLPFVDKDDWLEQSNYNDEWWDDILPKTRISVKKVKEFIAARGINYENKTQICWLLDKNCSVWGFLLFLDRYTDIGYYFGKSIEREIGLPITALAKG